MCRGTVYDVTLESYRENLKQIKLKIGKQADTENYELWLI